MINLHSVSYVRLGTRDIERSEMFATKYLGLELAERTRRATYFKSDHREHTLCYFEGDPTDQTVAFEVGSAEDLAIAATELERCGHDVHLGTTAEAESRKVRDFIAFDDPSGNRIELVVGPAHGGRRYHGTRDAGVTGFSHIGLCSTDPVRDEVFWTRICNPRVSDRIGEAPLLRINEVHHSIAIFASNKPGIQHINHQVESSDDIMRSWRFLQERQVPIVFGPGRHPSSSAKFLYFEGPDGMVFEFSSGVRLIADELLYRERQLAAEAKGFCQWGANPDIPEFRDK